MAASPPFQPALAASNRRARASRVVGIERIDPVLFVFFCGRSSSLTGTRNVQERANVIADLLFHAHCCVINVTSAVESFGNFPLPAGSRVSCGDRWLTEEPQLRDL